MVVGRRQLLKYSLAALASGMTVSSPDLYAKTTSKRRHIHLKNMHTGEEDRLLFWKNGEYRSSALKQINYLLRDHRNDQIAEIDKNLIEAIYDIHAKVNAPYGIEVYSGYRSPETNQALRQKNSAVAKKSLHMYGKAVDIRLPGVDLSKLHKAAVSLGQGGVGYYKRSGYIHIDTGRVRHWGG